MSADTIPFTLYVSRSSASTQHVQQTESIVLPIERSLGFALEIDRRRPVSLEF